MKLKSFIFYSLFVLISVYVFVAAIRVESKLQVVKTRWEQVQNAYLYRGASEQHEMVHGYETLANTVLLSVVEVLTNDGKRLAGTGFVIDSKKGYVLTARHVAKIFKKKSYIRQGVGFVKVLAIYSHPTNDIAVLVVDIKDLDYFFPLELELEDSNNIAIGNVVLGFGHPFHRLDSVSLGIVSALGRKWSAYPRCRFLQTDAATNPGNSGGPVVNLYGKVVGVLSGIVHGDKRSPRTGHGVNLAVDIESIEKTLVDFRKWLNRKEQK